MSFFKKTDWVMVDCVTGLSTKVEQLPFEIGAGEGVDLKLNGEGVAERHCAVNKVKGQGLCLIKQEPNLPLVVDGEPVEYCQLVPDRDYAIKIGAHFLALRGGSDVNTWLRGLDLNQWFLQDTATNQVDGPMTFEELCRFAKEHQRNPQSWVIPQGLAQGFLLYDAFEVMMARQAATEATDGLDEVEESLRLGQ